MGERDKVTLLRQLVALLVGLGWLSTSAAVALATPPQTLLELPWAQIAVGCLISLWGGLARTATRVLSAQRACGASWPRT